MEQPCSVCRRHRRASCPPGCIFKNIFPPDDEDFKQMTKIWDCKKLEREIMLVEENQRTDFVNSLKYEARLRRMNKVQGCLGYTRALEEENLILRTALSYFYLTAPADVMQQPLALRPMHHQSIHLHASMPAQQFANTSVPGAAFHVPGAAIHQDLTHWSQPGPSASNIWPTTQFVQQPYFRSVSAPGAAFHVPGAAIHQDLTHWSQPGPSASNIWPTTQFVQQPYFRSVSAPGAAFHVPGAPIHQDLTHLSQPGPSAPNMSSVQEAHLTSADLRPGPIPDALLQQDLSQPGTGQVQAANSGDSALLPGSGFIDFGFDWNGEEIGSAGGDAGCS